MIELNVPDITCNHCASTIRKAVADADRGATCDIDLDAKRVTVYSALPPSDFIEALEAVGYPSTLMRAVG